MKSATTRFFFSKKHEDSALSGRRFETKHTIRGVGPARELVRLKQPERFTGAFAWSPDSQWVFFARYNGTEAELFRVPAAGGLIQPAGLRAPMIGFFSIHPDGKRIAFQGGEEDLELWALEGFLNR